MSCRVSSCKTMPYLVMSCDITVTCLFHIVFNHDTRVRHQSEPPSHPKLLAGLTKTPQKCWVPVSQIWAKNCPEFEAQDPLRCTDAITRGSTLYVIQRIWSCINQNLNLPPHVAWVTFRGQKLFGLVFSIDIWCAAMCAHADATLSQLLINKKRQDISSNIEKLCAKQYFQKRLKNLYFHLSFNADIKKINA